VRRGRGESQEEGHRAVPKLAAGLEKEASRSGRKVWALETKRELPVFYSRGIAFNEGRLTGESHGKRRRVKGSVGAEVEGVAY